MTVPNKPAAAELLEKMRSHRALVSVIGLGYVGLRLALTFVDKGSRVLGFDVDPEKVAKLNRGECYIEHLDGGRVAAGSASGLLVHSTIGGRRSTSARSPFWGSPTSETSTTTVKARPSRSWTCWRNSVWR